MNIRTFFSTITVAIMLLVISFSITRPTYAVVVPVIDIGNAISQTITGVSTKLDALKEYGLDGVATNIVQRILNKMVDKTLIWASGGFDGEPGFLDTNFRDFSTGIDYTVYSNSLNYAGSVNNKLTQDAQNNALQEIRESCIKEVEERDESTEKQAELIAECNQLTLNNADFTLGGKISGALAEANYKNFMSGNLDTSRDAVGLITNFASRQLTTNSEQLDNLIEKKQSGLATYLGGQAKEEAYFNGDLSVAGLRGYALFADEKKQDEARLINSLQAKANTERNDKLLSLTTARTFFNKTTCEEYKIDAEGNRTQECLREKIVTPGGQVEERVNKALSKEEEQLQNAKELTDVLAQAAGRLADGLIQQGLSKLKKVVTQKSAAVLAEQDARFKDIFQDNYDILGIDEDTDTTSNNTGNDFDAFTPQDDGSFDINSSKLANDNSLPSIEELERIIDIETDIERGVKNTQIYIENRNNIVAAMREVIEPIKGLDRCIPGPDYGWEARYENLIDTTGMGYGGKYEDETEDTDDEEEEDTERDQYTSPQNNARANKLGLNLTKVMVTDPRINIPGATDMLSLVYSYLKQGNTRISLITEEGREKATVLSQLNIMKDAVKTDYVGFRQTESLQYGLDATVYRKIPIFESDWDLLTDTEKIAILSIKAPQKIDGLANVAVPGNAGLGGLNRFSNQGYLMEVEGSQRAAMILNERNGLTPAEFFNNNREQAKLVVLGYAWKVWRENMDTKEAKPDEGELSGTMQKNNIIKYYYTLRNTVPTNQDIEQGRLELSNIKSNNVLVPDYLADCLTMRFLVYDVANPTLSELRYSGKSYGNKNGEVYMLNLGNEGLYDTTLSLKEIILNTAGLLNNINGFTEFFTPGSIQQLNFKNLGGIPINDITQVQNLFIGIRNTVRNLPGGEGGGAYGLSHKQLATFLEREYEKQTDDNAATTSIFKTKIMTSPTQINNSILSQKKADEPPVNIDFGFGSVLISADDADLIDHYRINYGAKPDTTLENHDVVVSGPALRITQLFERDYVVSDFRKNNRKVSGRTGVLFCWTAGDYSLQKKGKGTDADKMISECLKPWYYTKDIEYKIIFSDIS